MNDVDHTHGKTMKAVVAQLRECAPEALLDLLELHVAVGELAFNLQLVSAVATELASELAEVAGARALVSGARLQEVAKVAAKTSEIVDRQSQAIAEIQRRLDTWNIAPRAK